jgi:hypothetical protein
MKLHFKNANIKNVNITMVFGTPPVTACVIFATYEMLVGRLAATMAFTTLSLFNILRFPLVVLPKALRALSEALASIARVEEFLLESVPTDFEGITKASRAGITIVSGFTCCCCFASCLQYLWVVLLPKYSIVSFLVLVALASPVKLVCAGLW